MIIHLTGSTRNINNDLPFLKEITTTIHTYGFSLARDWVEAARSRTNRGISGDHVDWEYIVQQDIAAIRRADAIVIEGSDYSFSQGYQTALSLSQRKPTLFLSRNNTLNSRYIHGINEESFTVVHYTNKESLNEAIRIFITNLK